MITITNIREMGGKRYDEVWGIVRSMKPMDGVRQVQVLSPSWELFKKYRNLVESGSWNRNAFQSLYVPQFLEEMHSKEASYILNKLYLMDKAGKNICLFCFCTDESLCHRSIIAGLLQGAGCNVEGIAADYSHYLRQWKTKAA